MKTNLKETSSVTVPGSQLHRLCMVFLFLFIPVSAWAETVGIFADPKVPQIAFAASEVKAALEKRGLTAEMRDIASLDAAYPRRKIVIALAATGAATALVTAQGGGAVRGLGEQAYELLTTAAPQQSCWAFGGDANGAMYGGLQIAEDIRFDGLGATRSGRHAPTVLKRGIKLNLPWDKASGTYGRYDKGTFDGTSAQLAIADVWDFAFWKAWFDEMARNRYNVVSLWSCNPFSSLVKVPGYEDCSIENVTYFDGTVKPMTMDQKIRFWQDVMAYAHSRGFEFLLFNWNVFTYGATGKHGIIDGKDGATDPDTIDYLYKAMTRLLETYPNLNGFGMSVGENGGTEEFAWNAYGKAMHDYAKANPKRNLKFIHRLHYGDFDKMLKIFAPLRAIPNVSFDLSVKHSQAHMYSTATPDWWPKEYAKIKDSGLKTWLTVRNDSFYYLTWGDPDFARAYIKGMLDLGSIYKGFYMGSDGLNPTRTFFCQNKALNGQLEVIRQQYTTMIWGRLAYDPKLPDETFIKYLQLRYPGVQGSDLFKAWSQSSRGIQIVNEVINRRFNYDYQWWPEACQRDTRVTKKLGGTHFVTIAEIAERAGSAPGSSLASIGESASGKLNGKKSTQAVAEEMETRAKSALALVKPMNASADAEMAMAIGNIRSMSYLALYYAYKIRGATFLAAKDQDKAKTALGAAYGWWMKYATLMDNMYTGMDMQRTDPLPDWHCRDQFVLKEFTDLGGVGIPVLDEADKD
jgi:hypothetical protein